jgi:murein tripeptide amidase MpaA
MAKVEIPFDTYYDYEQMTAHLKALASAYPELAKLSSIGKSHRGRDVWMVEITNPETGPGEDKPGYYIDAQIHAEEHATSATALYAVWSILITNYGTDEEVTRLVDTQDVLHHPAHQPRWRRALACQEPYHPWCGNGRFLPGADRLEGLIPAGPRRRWLHRQHARARCQGRVEEDPPATIRTSWCKARTRRRRRRVLPRSTPKARSATIDGVHVKIEKGFDGNMNRNFPINWSPREYGAGEYPFSEPEAMGMGRLILDHPNICGMCAYHTHGGIILRPSMMKYDADMSPRDLALYKDLGGVGTRLTGYPVISTYEDFTPDKSKARHGSLKDWVYEEMGIICFSTELWDLERTAGVDKKGYMNLGPRDADTQQKVFNWVLENVGDKGYRDWEHFDHPQLGPVEIGGMVYIWSYRNPPGKLLEEICHNNTIFNLRHAAAAPQVKIDNFEVEALGSDLYKVTAIVANHGYLPTNLSDVAIENKVAKTVTVALELEGAEIVINPEQQDLGHLAGRNERKYTWSPWGQQWSPTTKKVEWLVRSKAGGAKVTAVARSEKGGTHRLTETLA